VRILGIILLWLLIGDLLAALRPWDDDEPSQAIWFRLVWPTQVWWVLRRLIREWRTDLYQRTKYL